MSKRDIRDRLIRLIVAALVREDLSRAEQRAIVSSLGDSNFLLDLHSTIDAVFFAINENSTPSRPSAPRSKDIEGDLQDVGREEELLDEAMHYVRRRRLSKAGLRNILEKVDAQLARNVSDNSTIAVMLESFFLHSSPNRRIKLLSLLGSENNEDEYLRGIAERDN